MSTPTTEYFVPGVGTAVGATFNGTLYPLALIACTLGVAIFDGSFTPTRFSSPRNTLRRCGIASSRDPHLGAPPPSFSARIAVITSRPASYFCK